MHSRLAATGSLASYELLADRTRVASSEKRLPGASEPRPSAEPLKEVQHMSMCQSDISPHLGLTSHVSASFSSLTRPTSTSAPKEEP